MKRFAIVMLIAILPVMVFGCKAQENTEYPDTDVISEEDSSMFFEENDDVFCRNYKYGVFVHYVPGLSVDKDGNTHSVNETANAFDAAQFAEDIKSTGADYLIFTAWHAGMYTLYPSDVMKSYCPGRYSERDLIGDLLSEMNKVNIPVILYTHPYLGYHMNDKERISTGYGTGNDPSDSNLPNPKTFRYAEWNEFISSVYGELLTRYADKIVGLFIDEGTPNAKMGDYVDFPALESLIKSYGENILTVQNFYGTNYSCDIGIKEYGPGWGEFNERYKAGKWPCYEKPVCVAISKDWYSQTVKGKSPVRYSAYDMYRYIVMESGCNTDGLGTAWAAGCYVGSGWEDGVLETLREVGKYYADAGESVKGTRASTAYPTVSGTNLLSLERGYTANKSSDGLKEYIHVLNAPSENKLILPKAEDGRVFCAASFTDGTELSLETTDEGYTITLPNGYTWDDTDTIIVLDVSKRIAPTENKEYIRDTDPRIIYRGNWEYSRWERNCGDYENDVHLTSESGSSAVFEFDGSGIEIISPMYNTAGKCGIKLDDKKAEICDEFARTYHAQSIIYSSKGLENGHHTVTIVCESGEIAVDGMIIYK